jgi:hypothetical protein
LCDRSDSGSSKDCEHNHYEYENDDAIDDDNVNENDGE